MTRLSIIAYTGDTQKNAEEMEAWAQLEQSRGNAAATIVKQTATGGYDVYGVAAGDAATRQHYNNLTDLLAESVARGDVDVHIVSHGAINGSSVLFVGSGPNNTLTSAPTASVVATMFENALHNWTSRAASLPAVKAKITFDTCFSAVATNTGPVSENSFVQRFSEDLSRELRLPTSSSGRAATTTPATARINLEVLGAGGSVLSNNVPNGFVARINIFHVEDRLKARYSYTDFNIGTDACIARDIVHRVNEELHTKRYNNPFKTDPPFFSGWEIKDAWNEVTRTIATENSISTKECRALVSSKFVEEIIWAMDNQGLRDGWAVTRNLTGPAETVTWTPTELVLIDNSVPVANPTGASRGRSGVAADDQIAGDPDVRDMQSFAETSAECHTAIRADQELFTETVARRMSQLGGTGIDQDSVVYDDVAQVLRFRMLKQGVSSEVSQPLPLSQLKTPAVMAELAEDFAAARDDVNASGPGMGAGGVRGAMGAGMAVLGFIGAAQALKNGDHANAALGLAGGSVGALSAGKAAVDSHAAQALGKWLLKNAGNSATATAASPKLAQALRGGTRLLEAGGQGLLTLSRAGSSCLPVMGAAVQGAMIASDASDLVGGMRGANPIAVAAACVNLALDGAIAMADVVPGPGLIVSGPLSVVRMAWQPLVRAAKAMIDSPGSVLVAADSTPEGTILNGLASMTLPGMIFNVYASKRLAEQMREQGKILNDPTRLAANSYGRESPDNLATPWSSSEEFAAGDVVSAPHQWESEPTRTGYYVSVAGGAHPLPPVDWQTGMERSNSNWTFIGDSPPVAKHAQFDFIQGSDSYLAGYLDVWFRPDGRSAVVHTGPDAQRFGQTSPNRSGTAGSTAFQFPETRPDVHAPGYQAMRYGDLPVNTVVMGLGQSFHYTFATAEPRIFYVPIARRSIAYGVRQRASLESHYHAPDNADMTFVAPSRFPTGPASAELNEDQDLKPSDFTYVMYGGGASNTYLLGPEQAQIHCGTGSNEIVVPISPGATTVNTVDVYGLRSSSDCALKLAGIEASETVMVSRSDHDLTLTCKGTSIIVRGMASTAFNIELPTGIYQYVPQAASEATSPIALASVIRPIYLFFAADNRGYVTPTHEWLDEVAPNIGAEPVWVYDSATGSIHVANKNARSGEVDFNAHRRGGERGDVVDGGTDAEIELTCGPDNPRATLSAGTGHTTFVVHSHDGMVNVVNRKAPIGKTNTVKVPFRWGDTFFARSGNTLACWDGKGHGCKIHDYFDTTSVGEAVRRIQFVSSDGVVFSATNSTTPNYSITSVSDANALFAVTVPGLSRASPSTLDLSRSAERIAQSGYDGGFADVASIKGSDFATALVGPPAVNTVNLIAGLGGGLLKAGTGPTVFLVPPGVESVVVDNSAATTDRKDNLLNLQAIRSDELLVATVIDPAAPASNNRVIKLIKHKAPPSIEVEIRPGSFRRLVVQTADGVRLRLEPGSDGNFYPQDLNRIGGSERDLAPRATAMAESKLPVELTPLAWGADRRARPRIVGEDGNPTSVWPPGTRSVSLSTIAMSSIKAIAGDRITLVNGDEVTLPAGLSLPRYLVFKDGYFCEDSSGRKYSTANTWKVMAGWVLPAT